MEIITKFIYVYVFFEFVLAACIPIPMNETQPAFLATFTESHKTLNPTRLSVTPRAPRTPAPVIYHVTTRHGGQSAAYLPIAYLKLS